MRCTNCGNESTASKKFCATCGSALSRRCSKCGSKNAPASAFCEDCGAALAGNAALVATGSPDIASTTPQICVTPEQPDASTALDGERKTVTALFADIKGSTELMEDLDPEEARAIIDPALKFMIDAAHRYDGYVVQSTGDGIFALFGAPIAHEDHPQRALYAVLRLQENLERYSAGLREVGNLPIEGRVGVNTGEVVVRSISTGTGQTEYTPIGYTTNLASRMQALAPTGSIAISEQTRKLVEGYFALKPLGPTKVRGVSEPINVYEVMGLGPLRTRLQRAAGRGLTKFVGRQREMQSLKHAAELAKSGRGQLVAAMAEAGVGKSRLYFEFKATSQAGWMVLETFSVSHGKASAYLPVLELLHGYFKILPEDDARTRREKINGRVITLDRSLEEVLPYLFGLLGLVEGDDPLIGMDAQVRRRRTLEAIKRILLRESLNQPLMVIFEDLHWIDEETQAFLNLLVESIGKTNVMLLVNYRPEYSHQWNSKTYYTQLRLDPLGQESAAEMLTTLLGDGPDLLELKRLIIRRTEGNPFFVEEIVQALFEDGVLQRNGTVRLVKSMNAVKVPPTVQAVLAARIDRLPPDEKELLQTLATVGREFSLSLVREVVRKSADDLDRMMKDLQLAEFVYEQPAVGDLEYIFKHALTQQVAHDSMLTDRRKTLHERIGDAFESLYPSSVGDHLGEIAHHYCESNNGIKAAHYLGLSSEQALRRSHYNEAIAHATTGLSILSKISDESERLRAELALQLVVGRASIATAGYTSNEVREAFDRAAQICQETNSRLGTFSVLGGLFAFHFIRAEIGIAHELAIQALRIAEQEPPSNLLVDAHMIVGGALFWLGRNAEALAHSELAVSAYRPTEPLANSVTHDSLAMAFIYQAFALWSMGYPDRALEMAKRSVERAESVAHPHTVGLMRVLRLELQWFRRDRLSEEQATDLIKFSEIHGLPYAYGIGVIYRSIALLERGSARDALTDLSRMVDQWTANHSNLDLAQPRAALAQAYGREGEPEKGLTVITEALEELSHSLQRQMEPEFLRIKGELLLTNAKYDAQLVTDNFRTAIRIAREQSSKSWELRATMSLARLLVSQGNRDEALTMLAAIYNWFTEGFDTADLQDAKALLDQLAN